MRCPFGVRRSDGLAQGGGGGLEVGRRLLRLSRDEVCVFSCREEARVARRLRGITSAATSHPLSSSESEARAIVPHGAIGAAKVVRIAVVTA